MKQQKTNRLISRAAAMLLLMVLTTATARALSGSGTAADPYLISSVADWTRFASAVSDGMTYEDRTLKLTADINGITTMAGTSDNRFKGTFMGDGHTLTVNYTATGENCAPFLYIEGATINTLKVAGTISTGYKCAAGIVAHTYGDCTIQNCWSNVAITTTISGDGTHGGLVAVHEDGSLSITNCLFDGSITGSSTINCGGFVGWRNATLTFTNCFQNGTLSLKQTSGSATFNRNGGATLTNSYYKTAYGDVQGQQTDATGETLRALLGSCWEVSGGKVVPIMSLTNIATATISGIDECYLRTGEEIKPEPVVTAADGTVLTKGTHYALSWSGDGKTDGTYTITVTGAGSYTGSQQFSYVVKSSETLGGHDFQFGKDDEGLFYKISSSDDLRALATYVNAGNTCEGKRFKQTADINLGGSSNLFTPIGVGKKSGNSDKFAGIYDGGSHTVSGLSVSYSQPSASFAMSMKAPSGTSSSSAPTSPTLRIKATLVLGSAPSSATPIMAPLRIASLSAPCSMPRAAAKNTTAPLSEKLQAAPMSSTATSTQARATPPPALVVEWTAPSATSAAPTR